MENTNEQKSEEYATLSIGSGLYKTELTTKFQNREKWETPDPKKIKTFIPGTVVDVLVRPGQEVKKGEVLLIIEAMKIQNMIIMPFDGKVKKVVVKPDDVLKKNELMIELV